MRPFARPTLRWTAGVFGAVGAVVALSAGVRILPWLVDKHVAWGPLGVFGRGLLVVGTETTLLVALPLGWALAAAALHDRGEARACLLAGASPFRLVAGTLPLAAALTAIALVPSVVWGKDATAAGVLVRGFLASARTGCNPGKRPVSDVPMVGAAWLCPPGAPARLTAVLGGAVVRVEGATPSDDLRTVEAHGITIDMRGPPTVRFEATEGRLVGLRPYARAGGTARVVRPVAVALAALAAALGAMSALVSMGEGRRLVAVAVGGGAAAASLVALTAVERAGLGPAFYALVPLAALVPPWVARAARFGAGRALRWPATGGSR
jgi:hypothetical protein